MLQVFNDTARYADQGAGKREKVCISGYALLLLCVCISREKAGLFVCEAFVSSFSYVKFHISAFIGHVLIVFRLV